MSKDKKRVIVGLSGGVDSSVAAALLKEQGYDVVGITMAIYDEALNLPEVQRSSCLGPDEKDDIAMAKLVCKKLDIPFKVIDLKREYKTEVLSYFKEEYLAGRTPNPCVVCNAKMKFGFLLEKAIESGLEFDYFATGHYANIYEKAGEFQLHKATDLNKDQTYFIHRIEKSILPKVIFPLGEMDKKEIWNLAIKYDLPTKEVEESQDFINGNYDLLFDKDQIVKGDIIDESGKVLGEHNGIIHYTVGQRKGLGISNPKPLYVRMVDAKNNRIIVSEKEHLFSKGLIADDLSLLVDKLDVNEDLTVQIRKNNREIPADVKIVNESEIEVIFDTPQLAVTPGQSVVILKGTQILGGAIIKEAISL
jgi:tRNA-specific 2-thiouridylase